MQDPRNTAFGVTTNVIGSVLFALMFAYSAMLDKLGGGEAYGWRILLTFPCLTLIVLVKRDWPLVLDIYRRAGQQRFFWMMRSLSAVLLGMQLWVFVWAPYNGYALDVSLGYFLMPIAMVVLGKIAFRDRMSNCQKASFVFASIAVFNQFLIAQSLTWPTLLIGLGYPIYFWLRRQTNTNNIGGLWFDMLLALPAAIFFIVHDGFVLSRLFIAPDWLLLVLGLGVISALALTFQAFSAPHLNMSLFGLLIYIEPIFLLMVSVLLGEKISASEWPTYLAIWMAVSMLGLEGLRGMLKRTDERAGAP